MKKVKQHSLGCASRLGSAPINPVTNEWRCPCWEYSW
jgi:hypothetical protein